MLPCQHPLGHVCLRLVVAIAILNKLQRALAATRREQVNRNRARVRRAIASCRNLRHPAIFITYEKLRELGKFTSHETARSAGVLHTFDTYEQLKDFIRDEATVFISHQWLSRAEPDPNEVQFRALLEACDELCNRKGLAAGQLYIWLDYVSIPQVNVTLKQLAIDSLAIYSSACRYFIMLTPDATNSDTLAVANEDTYGKRGWCRLEQWANASPPTRTM